MLGAEVAMVDKSNRSLSTGVYSLIIEEMSSSASHIITSSSMTGGATDSGISKQRSKNRKQSRD